MKNALMIALFLLAAACGSRETQSTETSQQTSSTPPPAASAASEYDLQFIDTMAKHHEMAVMMGEMATQKASDAKVKEFGRKVVEDQKKDIQKLSAWRSQWYPNAANAHNMQLSGASSMDMDMGHMQTMSGHGFDMMFVDMMIPHHKGALDMSREALQKAQKQELKDFAQETIDKQQKEITELEAWKSSMGMKAPAASSKKKPA